ncbi:hypothetical protein [Sinisalibacter aestuarii]|uniref:MarR family transcriptional regulator n=1 Tax=Sinisalibacter aestuarii TaxID=2949426 RepID=A0ABQ5LSJ6_9RHOB|nr:hypothetical protein [Sinisalibacter aestuarii]GKY87588.1 hypothetical protein STA1M1_14570 [Sinisalibacter aestuarii]
MSMPAHTVAVLTGDLIGSTASGETATDEAMASLHKTTVEIAKWRGVSPPLRFFDRYRGDGWQILLTHPAYALRATLVLAATLASTAELPRTRIGIGIGPADIPDNKDFAASTGAAFIASGHALDTLPRARVFAIEGEHVTSLHRAILALAEELSGRWTPEQAEATALYLSPRQPTLAAIAERLGISTQAVSYRIRGAGARALRDAATWWEQDAEDRAP